MNSKKLNGFSAITTKAIKEAKEKFGTPMYLYDQRLIDEKCRQVRSMPHAYGIGVRYAMKANSNKTILKTIGDQNIAIDASSLNEAKRAHMAGISLDKIMLTTQDVPLDQERKALERLMLKGLKYNVCSLRQLFLIGDFARKHALPLSIRIHPGVGSGESSTRNTGDKYSCFGVHMSNIREALDFAKSKGVAFTQVHVHIGSGADPKIWKDNIDRELGFIEQYFPDAQIVSFGGGIKEARMPDEVAADIKHLGLYAKSKIEQFYKRTNRKLTMEVEPGTYIVANCGYIITTVIDKKWTGKNGFEFLILNGGMEVNARPLMYGSRHPFYIVSKDGRLLSSEFYPDTLKKSAKNMMIVGRCCESGDSQCLGEGSKFQVRAMADPEIGDMVVIGGAGAYCSSMTPFNYNSYVQIPEALFTSQGDFKLIRKKQTLQQIVINEL
jgi:diaminopimelate decarboxylase